MELKLESKSGPETAAVFPAMMELFKTVAGAPKELLLFATPPPNSAVFSVMVLLTIETDCEFKNSPPPAVVFENGLPAKLPETVLLVRAKLLSST